MKITEMKKQETTKSDDSGSVSVTSSNVDMTDSVTSSKECPGIPPYPFYLGWFFFSFYGSIIRCFFFLQKISKIRTN